MAVLLLSRISALHLASSRTRLQSRSLGTFHLLGGTMSCPAEYHVSVRYSIPATFAFCVLALMTIFVPIASAQINGAPASVTSPGFGSHAINRPRVSVAAVRPQGYAPQPPGFRGKGKDVGNDGHHHHPHYIEYWAPFLYALPVPYAVDIGAADEAI